MPILKKKPLRFLRYGHVRDGKIHGGQVRNRRIYDGHVRGGQVRGGQVRGGQVRGLRLWCPLTLGKFFTTNLELWCRLFPPGFLGGKSEVPLRKPRGPSFKRVARGRPRSRMLRHAPA